MDESELNETGREQWNAKARFWDELHGDDGNIFHRTLVSPSVERLLALEPGEQVLDIGCGNGVMARRMAELGANVTAIDFSEALIKLARDRGQSAGPPIDYRLVDATDETALVALGEAQFDAITCTMAVMDMPVIVPMFRAVAQLLNGGGRFVFATMHPAFNSNNPVFFVEQADRDGELVTEYGIKLTAYLEITPVLGVGARDEPAAHYYYHRPLHELLNTAFRTGMVMDAMEEPAFPRDDESTALNWRRMWQIPPVMTVRLRVR